MDTSSWGDCVGKAVWIAEPLQNVLKYPKPLPVQQVVVPLVSRALLSGIPMDVSLTAPTGSGKTLCYLLPMLQLITAVRKGIDDTQLRALVLVPTKALGQQVFREIQRLVRHTSVVVATLCAESGSLREEAQSLIRTVKNIYRTPDNDVDSVDGKLCFSCVDILVSTPQRLLSHLDATTGFSLASLRLLVIDEADQVLAGNFANFVVKVVDRFEEDAGKQRRDEAQSLTHLAPSHSWTQTSTKHAAIHAIPTLHKIMCSATLSSRIARISEVRLKNCRYFTLDTMGTDVSCDDDGESAVLNPEEPTNAAPTSSSLTPVKTSFALPPKLQEHIVFVDDSYRHAVLLKLVCTILSKIQAAKRKMDVTRERGTESGNEDVQLKDASAKDVGSGITRAKSTDGEDSVYPSFDADAGSTVLVFCSSAEEARVMGHFLSAAGIHGVVEFTTLATESERRRALLRAPSCVVASDALMRGIDMPNVGHVIMYHPPESLSQYVHRSGRTARAMRSGHLHVLLNKVGPSGTQTDGEVARHKQLSALVSRMLPIRYERHFFMFETPPGNLKCKAPSTATPSTAAPTDDATAPMDADAERRSAAKELVKDTAEWWVNEANRYLSQSKHHLQHKWMSAMESSQSQVHQRDETRKGTYGRHGSTHARMAAAGAVPRSSSAARWAHGGHGAGKRPRDEGHCSRNTRQQRS